MGEKGRRGRRRGEGERMRWGKGEKGEEEE